VIWWQVDGSNCRRLYDADVDDFFRSDAADLAEDTRHLLIALDQDPSLAQFSDDCRPPLDVLETASAVEVIVDVPGISAGSLRVGMRRNTVLIVGAKAPPSRHPGARFHVAERAYGRFVRAVRINGAVDPAGATANVSAGQLHVVVPRTTERRGQVISIAVTSG
jgi:HSP20 family protein